MLLRSLEARHVFSDFQVYSDKAANSQALIGKWAKRGGWGIHLILPVNPSRTGLTRKRISLFTNKILISVLSDNQPGA